MPSGRARTGSMRFQKGAWRIQVRGRHADGTPLFLSRTVHEPDTRTGQARAQLALDELVAESFAPPKVTPGSFADIVDRWIRARTPDWSPSTVANTRLMLDKHVLPKLGAIPVTDVRPLDVQAVVDGLYVVLAPASVDRVHAMVRSCFEQAVDWELISVNPARRIRRPRKKGGTRRRTPTAETVRVAIDSVKVPNLKMLLRLAVNTGARRGELVALRWRDVNLDQRTVLFKQTKTGTEKLLPLGAATVKALEEHRDLVDSQAKAVGVRRPEWVFPSWQTGSHIIPHTVTMAWRRIQAKHPELEGVRFHDLRHTTATTLLGSHDAVTVAGRLGHASPAMTLNTYGHQVDERDRAAAEAMDAWLES